MHNIDLTGFILVVEFMENVEQINNEYLDTKGEIQDKMNPTIRSKIIFGIASTMKKIHKKKAIHRDLTLQHIYLDKNLELRIGGFEQAKFINNDMNMTMVDGTPLYMAPETFIDGDCFYDFSVDVYSYCLFYIECS